MTQPEIRFNGFSDEWVEKKLGDVSNLIQGAAWKSSEYLETGPNLLITISNLKSAIVDTSFGNRLAEVSLDLQKKYGIANNDVLVSMTGNVGRVSIYKDCIGAPKALLNQRVGKVIPVNIDNLFLYAILRNELFERKMIDKGQGAAQLNISSKDIQQFKIQLPTLPEQQKIGSLFSKYDTIIALREQKLEELNALKKGLLQKMFDDGVATSHKPQVRFSGFNDVWLEKKLGDVSNRVTRKNKDNESNRILTISAEDGLVDQIEYFNKQIAGRDLSGYFLMKNGEFAYNKSYSNGHPWGAIKRLDKYDTGVLSSLYIVFQPKNIDSQFLVAYYDTTSWHKGISMNATEGARNHGLLNIAPIDFFNTVMNIPSLPEQQKIGQLFKQLDDRISNEQTKIEQLKAQKQGLLQRML